MEAFKFLRPGRVGQISGTQWPEPGEWLDGGTPSLCRSGIHALRVEVLPAWIAEELWRVEVDDVQEFDGILVGRRGRLLAQVAAWNDETAREFAQACAERVPVDGPQLALARAADVVRADDDRRRRGHDSRLHGRPGGRGRGAGRLRRRAPQAGRVAGRAARPTRLAADRPARACSRAACRSTAIPGRPRAGRACREASWARARGAPALPRRDRQS